jgi:hypothetical protein
MQDKILLLCPTRERATKCKLLYNNILNTTSPELIDILFILDDDDPELDLYKQLNLNIITIKNKKPGLVYPLNFVYRKYKNKYKIFGFIGDDVSFHTKDWDRIIYNNIQNKNYDTVAYGNDLLRGDCLLTAFFIGNNFLNKIGYMAYPDLNHVFVDTFWRLVASRVNKLLYFPNLIIKHDHYTINNNYDKTYERTSKFAEIDEKIYFDMEKNKLSKIIEIIK